MRYVEAKKGKALAAGFKVYGHRTNSNRVILNEKEVMNNFSLAGYETLEEKAAAIDGKVYSRIEIQKILTDYE